MSRIPGNIVAISFLLLIVATMSACSTITSGYVRGFGENLGYAINSHNDAETVAAALPAYLIFLDSMALKKDSSADTKLAAAHLYTAYASLFVDDEKRRMTLSSKALGYASAAVCQSYSKLCQIQSLKYEQFKAVLDGFDADDAPTLYMLGLTWVAWIEAHKSDWVAIAQLAQVKHIMNRVIELDEAVEEGGAHFVLGVINTLVPPAMGGKPEIARKHFERAIQLSEQRNLSYQVALAEYYARLVFDKELHDQLLKQVLSTKDSQERYTLQNTIAKNKAKSLLATSDEYF